MLKKVVKTITKINQSMLIVGGVVLALLSLVVFYDVIARYFFNSPTRFGFDLSTWLTGIAAFLTGGYVLLHNDHIRVDVFYERFSDRIKSLVEVITGIFILLIVIALVWYGGARVIQLYESGSVASTGLNISLWIKWSILPIGGLLLGLQATINLIRSIYNVCTGKRLWEEED
ncbi:TRAP transporter small permease [Alkalihalobacillus sp. MEB130]|uniref:TRAP transporter small permease subunit n=1 Tax=Alkalihalobacillus sp. MEB130 TaxID=2976704 RepID=UPI0028DFF36B|nr:TRAP transporter small permease [Alkalihalobacillus sp. MEB130]MDT8862968.1 TRAP transporter small permease [Alkalihalobacillus sp. MEB130]